jgi:hypothetical protein
MPISRAYCAHSFDYVVLQVQTAILNSAWLSSEVVQSDKLTVTEVNGVSISDLRFSNWFNLKVSQLGYEFPLSSVSDIVCVSVISMYM